MSTSLALVKTQLYKSQYNRWQIHNLSQDSKLIVAFKLIKLKEKIFNILNYFLHYFQHLAFVQSTIMNYYGLCPRTMSARCSVLRTSQKKQKLDFVIK